MSTTRTYDSNHPDHEVRVQGDEYHAHDEGTQVPALPPHPATVGDRHVVDGGQREGDRPVDAGAQTDRDRPWGEVFILLEMFLLVVKLLQLVKTFF